MMYDDYDYGSSYGYSGAAAEHYVSTLANNFLLTNLSPEKFNATFSPFEGQQVFYHLLIIFSISGVVMRGEASRSPYPSLCQQARFDRISHGRSDCRGAESSYYQGDESQ